MTVKTSFIPTQTIQPLRIIAAVASAAQQETSSSVQSCSTDVSLPSQSESSPFIPWESRRTCGTVAGRADYAGRLSRRSRKWAKVAKPCKCDTIGVMFGDGERKLNIDQTAAVKQLLCNAQAYKYHTGSHVYTTHSTVYAKICISDSVCLSTIHPLRWICFCDRERRVWNYSRPFLPSGKQGQNRTRVTSRNMPQMQEIPNRYQKRQQEIDAFWIYRNGTWTARFAGSILVLKV